MGEGGGKDSKLMNMSGIRGNASENKQMFKQSVTNIAVDIGIWQSCNL